MKTHDFSFGLTELKSSYYFLDLLLDKQNRSILTPFLFPETIFFFEGSIFFFHYPIPPIGTIKAWIFPTKTLPARILQKKPENATMPSLMKRFLGTSEPEPIKFAMQPIQERTEATLFQPIALVWVMGRNKAKVVDGPELYNYLTERKTSLVLIQEFMTFEGKTHSSTSIETFICEFKENKGIRNFIFSKRFKLFEEKTDNPHSEMFKPEYWKLRIRKGKVQTIENKSLDKRLNDAVEENMTKILAIIEKKGCKILKAIGKFLVDDHGNCFFKGLDEVFIERRENLTEEMDLEELMMMKRPIIKEKAMVRVRKNVKGVYSLNLRKSLMEERCEGDFCEFVGLKMIK